MSEIQEIEKLFVYTVVVNGVEKIATGVDGIPFIYLSKEAIITYKIPENMQRWANQAGITLTLKVFMPLTTLDIIEPMQTTTTM
jgi:hypothetical protein